VAVLAVAVLLLVQEALLEGRVVCHRTFVMDPMHGFRASDSDGPVSPSSSCRRHATWSLEPVSVAPREAEPPTSERPAAHERRML
jgi:hypothetical protein